MYMYLTELSFPLLNPRLTLISNYSDYQEVKTGDDMPLVIDPAKNGFEKVLREYQIEALKLIWAHKGDGMTSREVYLAVNDVLGSKSVSRASIINFLNAMCDEKVLAFVEETCKGGMRRKYNTGLDESGFKVHIAEMVLKSLVVDFPDETILAIRNSLSGEQLGSLHD